MLAEPGRASYAKDMADLSGTRLGAYTLIERIGRGGMSDVYRARNDQYGVDVAVKVLTLKADDEESHIFSQRFAREIEIIRKLKHPHLLPILDYGEQDDHIYFVTPLIPGGTLADIVRRGVSTPEATCHWLLQIGAALDHAHQNAVIHRDMKPTNILLDEDGNAYLTDFGIALLSSQTRGLTQTGNVVGTPAYMAPEQWRGESLDPRTDVYGLAIMVYLLLTKHVPFEAETAHAMMYMHLDNAPPSMRQFVPAWPEAVDAVVLRALAKDPAGRYPSAGAFAGAFKQAVDGVPASPPTPPAQRVNNVEYPPPPVYVTAPTSYDHLRAPMRQTQPRLLMAAFGLTMFLVIGLTVGVGLLVFNALQDNTDAASAPAPTTTPNQAAVDVPRIRLDDPRGDARLGLGETLRIELTAFDSQGVTHVELRRFGQPIERVEADDPRGVSPFPVTLDYTPTATGQYRLELIAFRGDTPGDARYILLEVR